jgi:hypothetical protein
VTASMSDPTARAVAYELAELLWRVLPVSRLDLQGELEHPAHLLVHLNPVPGADKARDYVLSLPGIAVQDVRDTGHGRTRWLAVTATWRGSDVTLTVFHQDRER